MKVAAFFLLFAGWIIVLAALGVLPPGAGQAAFVLSGIAVEVLGLVLAIRSHRIVARERGPF